MRDDCVDNVCIVERLVVASTRRHKETNEDKK